MKIHSMLERVRAKKTALIALLLFWIAAIIILQPFSCKGTETAIYTEKKADAHVGEIYDCTVKQTFAADENGLMSLSVMMATFARQNTARYTVAIYDEGGRTVAKETVYSNTLNDNTYYKIDFLPQWDSAGRKYTLKIRSKDAASGNAITLWRADAADGGTKLTIDGRKADGQLLLNQYFSDKRVYILKICVWVIIILLSFLVCLFISGVTPKDFLILSLFLGVLFVFVTPLFHRIDELTHFYKAVSVSSGDFFSQSVIQDGQIGAVLPTNAQSFAVYRDNVEIENVGKLRTLFTNDMWWRPFSDQKAFVRCPYASTYLSISYLPSAIGLAIGNTLGLPVICVLWLGRLCNYIVYTLISWYTLKITKYYRSLFFILACAPYGLFLAGSFSFDGILNASSLLFIAICLKYIFAPLEGKMQIKEKIALILCSMVIFSSKYAGYAPIAFIFLFVPRTAFAKREFGIMCGLLLLSLICMAGWQIALLNKYSYKEDRNGYTDVIAQMKYIYHNPGQFIKTFVQDIAGRSAEYMRMMHGYGDAFLSVQTAISFFPLAAACLSKDKFEFYDMKHRKRLLTYFGLASFVMIAIILVSLYLAFNPVGSQPGNIAGVGQRYFQPFYIFILMCISALPMTNGIKNWDNKIAFIMEIGVLNLIMSFLRVNFSSIA